MLIYGCTFLVCFLSVVLLQTFLLMRSCVWCLHIFFHFYTDKAEYLNPSLYYHSQAGILWEIPALWNVSLHTVNGLIALLILVKPLLWQSCLLSHISAHNVGAARSCFLFPAWMLLLKDAVLCTQLFLCCLSAPPFTLLKLWDIFKAIHKKILTTSFFFFLNPQLKTS